MTASTLGLLAFCGSVQAAELPIPVGPTGPTGPAGPTGPSSACIKLAKGQQETGGWATAMDVPAGGRQMQVDAAISYPCPIGDEPNKVVYLTEKKVEEGGIAGQCEGSANKPIAIEGYLCIYQGAVANFGSRETEWMESEFYSVQNLKGDNGPKEANKPELIEAKFGVLVVFRTKGFNELAPTKVVNEAQLTAAGSWAVREKT